jgi:UDP-glucose 4-epimerase
MKSMVSQIIDKIYNNETIQLFEHGEQTRDFIYVKDIAICNLLAGISNTSGIYNCGSGKMVDFNTIVKILQSYTSNELITKYIKCPYDFFQKETYASMDLTNKDLCFIPQYSVAQGIYDMKTEEIFKN